MHAGYFIVQDQGEDDNINMDFSSWALRMLAWGGAVEVVRDYFYCQALILEPFKLRIIVQQR